MEITKGVIPAAGLGLRMLPVTKSMPKEMLPVLKKPVIQYVVEELDKTGAKNILIITGKGKRAIEDHFDTDYQLIDILEKEGKNKLLNEVEVIRNLGVNLFYTRQSKPTGLADAVYLAKEFVDNDHFILALGDEIILKPQTTFTQKLMKYHKKKGAAVTLSLERCKPEHASKYGIIEGEQIGDNFYSVTKLVEKPKKPSSNLRIASRYILGPEIFYAIEKITPGYAGEKQLTDAIELLRKEGHPVYALEMSGDERIYNTGKPLDYYKTFIELCLEDKEVGRELKKFIKRLI
jgi:UTP--glucose-1-phosphate uridylyltransferase